MSMYYLHRAGETTGPFAPGRLQQMWRAREIGPADQVCEHGSDEWLPAEVIAMPTLEEDREVNERTAWIRALRPYAALSWALWSLGIVIAVLTFGAAWFLYVPLLVVGFFFNPPRYVCAGCGNRLEKTSARCPSCAARIVPFRKA